MLAFTYLDTETKFLPLKIFFANKRDNKFNAGQKDVVIPLSQKLVSSNVLGKNMKHGKEVK